MTQITRNILDDPTPQVACDVVYELSGGNLAVVKSIVEPLAGQPLSLVSLWIAVGLQSIVQQLAPCAVHGDIYHLGHENCSQDCCSRAVLLRHRPTNRFWIRFYLGIAKVVTVNAKAYVRLLSPFVNCVFGTIFLRLNCMTQCLLASISRSFPTGYSK